MIGSTDAEVIAESLDDPARFGEIFDRHAQPIFRFLGRRIGADNADDVLGDVFVTAFDHRRRYDRRRPSALPWLYGIASNLMRKHFRRKAVELRALERLTSVDAVDDPTDAVAASLDARGRLEAAAKVLEEVPADERNALLLFAWEELTYDEIGDVLGVPVGTVRSRLNRARQRLRAGTDEIDSIRAVRPDRVAPIPDATPTLLNRQKERLMQAIDWNRPGAEDILRTPDVHARLAYRDERAALEHLVRVFGFEEVREARTDLGGSILAFLRMGDGLFMIGREAPGPEHRIHSPAALGGSTIQMQVRVHDIDAHYERAVAEGADITMPLEDAF
ncbi:MAG TPA: sigma-70 family RNA polymerase sigma factor, partial [Acidimicrobiales bacterium]|nr:sigma-70 family RNA polymerase sigma factor [Acidimicrobiales bacterium]